jgi:hypothetical protein
MDTKHTSNAWRTSFRYNDDGDICEARVVEAGDTAVIATVCLDNAVVEDQREFNDRAEANTRLLAAAPDLLEVVQGVLDLWDANGEQNYYTAAIGVSDLRKMAKDAMAEATGNIEQAEQGYFHDRNGRGTIREPEDKNR